MDISFGESDTGSTTDKGRGNPAFLYIKNLIRLTVLECYDNKYGLLW